MLRITEITGPTSVAITYAMLARGTVIVVNHNVSPADPLHFFVAGLGGFLHVDSEGFEPPPRSV